MQPESQPQWKSGWISNGGAAKSLQLLNSQPVQVHTQESLPMDMIILQADKEQRQENKENKKQRLPQSLCKEGIWKLPFKYSYLF